MGAEGVYQMISGQTGIWTRESVQRVLDEWRKGFEKVVNEEGSDESLGTRSLAFGAGSLKEKVREFSNISKFKLGLGSGLMVSPTIRQMFKWVYCQINRKSLDGFT